MHARRRASLLLAVLLILATACGCRPRWQMTVVREGSAAYTLDADAWREWSRAFPDDVRDGQALALERALWQAGVPAVQGVRLASQEYDWAAIHRDAWLLRDGQVRIGAQTVAVDELTVLPSDLNAQVRLVDLAPTLAGALGVRSPAGTTGRAVGSLPSQRVVVVAIDGLSYLAYSDVSGQNITVLLDTLGAPKLALSSYPSTPDAAALAALCGSEALTSAAEPPRQTLFDVLSEADKLGVAITSATHTADLGATRRVVLEPASATEDLTDTAVNAALDLLQDESPALIWLQLDALSRAAAQYGLGTDETTAQLVAIDAQLQRLVSRAPLGTLLIVLGTHGVHPTTDLARLAEGGSLLASDMYVPLWIVEL